MPETENRQGNPGETPEAPEHEHPEGERHDAGHGETPDALKEALRKERERTKALDKANKDRERRLQELEEKEREREAATLSDAEKRKRDQEQAVQKARDAESRAAKAEAENLRLRIDHAVYIEAADKGFEYPQDVAKLIDRDRIDVDAETGRIDPKSVKETVERLAKDRPGLLKARSGGGTPPRDVTRRTGGEPPARDNRNINPYEQELLEMGGGGRM